MELKNKFDEWGKYCIDKNITCKNDPLTEDEKKLLNYALNKKITPWKELKKIINTLMQLEPKY